MKAKLKKIVVTCDKNETLMYEVTKWDLVKLLETDGEGEYIEFKCPDCQEKHLVELTFVRDY